MSSLNQLGRCSAPLTDDSGRSITTKMNPSLISGIIPTGRATTRSSCTCKIVTACGGVLRRQVEALDAKTEEEFREGLTLPAVIGSADTEIDEEAIAS